VTLLTSIYTLLGDAQSDGLQAGAGQKISSAHLSALQGKYVNRQDDKSENILHFQKTSLLYGEATS
jgi:hypothetical protein